MVLVKRFYLRDIRNYERENNANILNYFNNVFDLYNLIELIKIGNRVDTLEAVEILDDYLTSPENDLVSAYEEIRDTLLGKPVEQGEESNLQTVKFNSMTDLLNELCKQAMSIGLTYTEFWGMDTKEMYQVVEGIQERRIEEFNQKANENFMLVNMICAGLCGKLKEPPQIYDPNKLIYTEEFGEIDMQTYKQLQAIGAVR